MRFDGSIHRWPITDIGKPEVVTQNRVLSLFRNELGYRYLGDWTDRPDNSNIEEGATHSLAKGGGLMPEQIASALHKLRTEANNHSRRILGCCGAVNFQNYQNRSQFHLGMF